MEAAPVASDRARATAAFRSRDFRLLWSGQTVSLVGDGAFLIALGWRTTALTGKSSSLAIVLMVHGLALLTTLLIGGALADRYSRRTLMIVSDLARCAVIAALAGIDASGHLTFGILLAGAALFGLGDGFFYPAFGGIVPLVVESHELASANTLIGVSRQGAFVVGPALAGGIYGAAGSAAVFGFDAASFIVSAALLFLARPRVFQRESSEGTLSEIVAGARYVMSVPWLWIGIFVSAFVLMVAMAPYQALLPKFVQGQFHRGVGSYGLLFAVQSLGMAAGTLLFGRVNPRRRRVIQIFGFLALNDLFVIGLALVPSFAAGAVFVTIRGVFIGYAITAWGTLLMEQVPESKLSRVTSLDFFGSTGLVPVGYALTAIASSFASPATILLAGFSLAFVLWSAPLASRTFREAA
jgi:MFS family permease